jgi:ribulose-phosphate 3-epimerase
MPVELIPVINVKTSKKFLERWQKLKNFSGIFQLDIADGTFTSWKTWNDPAGIKKYKIPKGSFEVHLMSNVPHILLPKWLEVAPKRIFVHLETIKNFNDLLTLCQSNKIELGLALKAETPLEQLNPYLKDIASVLFLGVDPGPSGQKFQWFVLDKIQKFRRQQPAVKIELDGGVNEEVFKEAVKIGVNRLAVGSAIFETKNPEQKIQELQKLLSLK